MRLTNLALSLLAAAVLVALGGRLVARWISAGDGVDPAAGDGARATEEVASGQGAAELPIAESAVSPGARAPSPAVEFNDLAVAALERGAIEEALALLERCLALEPEDPTFRHNTAETLARLARREREAGVGLAGPVARLERALGLAPDRADIARLLERWTTEVELERDFYRESSLHFDLSYDGSREDLLHGSHRLIELLELAYGEFGELYQADPAGEDEGRLGVSLYREEEFTRLTGLGDWAGGVYDGTVRIPVEKLGPEGGALDRVLRHELSHAFTRALAGGTAPGWLSEGLAQLLEGDDGGRIRRARAGLRGSKLFDLEALGGSLAGWTNEGRIRRAYDQSLAFSAYLEGSYGRDILYEMLRGLAGGRDCGETFREVCGLSLETALADFSYEL